MGRNGAGKTSLLRAIAGLIRPLAGTVRFQGKAGEVPAEDARSQGLHLVGHHDGLKTGRTAFEELLFQVRWTGGTARQRRGGVRAAGAAAAAGPGGAQAVGRPAPAGGPGAGWWPAPRPLWLLDEPLAPLDAEQRDAVRRP